MSGAKTGPGGLVDRIEETLIALLLGLMTAVTFANVIARFVFNSNILWALELTVFTFGWLVLLGASYAVKKHAHLGVDAILNMLKGALELRVEGQLGESEQRSEGARERKMERPPRIFVGDVQGCADELERLVKQAQDRFGSDLRAVHNLAWSIFPGVGWARFNRALRFFAANHSCEGPKDRAALLLVQLLYTAPKPEAL